MRVCWCVCARARTHSHTVCTRVHVCGSCVSVAGLPVMIDPDSVSPCWRISVALNACYHGNRLPAHRSGTQTIVSLPLSTSAALPIVYPIFSPTPPFIFPFFSLFCIDFHPFTSVLPCHAPPFFCHSPSFHSVWRFLPLSIHSCQPCCHALTSLSTPPTSSFSPVTSSSSSLCPFIHPCVFLCFIFNSPFLYILCLFVFPVLYFSQTGSTRLVHQWTVLNMCTVRWLVHFLGALGTWVHRHQGLTLPKLPLPSTIRKLKSASFMRSWLPLESNRDAELADLPSEFLPGPILALWMRGRENRQY